MSRGKEEEEMMEKPSEIPATLPESPSPSVDLFSQAMKALCERSPNDVADDVSTAGPAVGGGSAAAVPATLPRVLATFLTRHADSRRRHNKSHAAASSEKKRSRQSEKAKGYSLWAETEEYFRPVKMADMEALAEAYKLSKLAATKCFEIPSKGNVCEPNGSVVAVDVNVERSNVNEVVAELVDGGNVAEVIGEDEKADNGSGDSGAVENGGNENGVVEDEVKTEQNVESMEIDNTAAEACTLPEEERTRCSGSDSFEGVEWLLGCKNKTSLSTERPSKKRKVLGADAGLEKVIDAAPCDGNPSLCHFCSKGDSGNKLNRLIVCSSCKVVVHQKCYGVSEGVDASWLCSWCMHKTDSNSVTPCVLCSKQGGALKPVTKGDDRGGPREFAHLFCCQWMPEAYIEDMEKVEPIMNVGGIPEVRRKLTCNICKVKWGACVRCSHGACRTSFHPMCAREARQRMEIWAKFGLNNVELKAFCSKHSEVPNKSITKSVDPLVSVDRNSNISDNCQVNLSPKKLNKSEVGRRNGDKVTEKLGKFRDNRSQDMPLNDEGKLEWSCEDIDASEVLNLAPILQKLIDCGKVDVKDVALEIGISPDSLSASLVDDSLVPDVQRRIAKWLKDNTYLDVTHKMKTKSKSSFASMVEFVGSDASSSESGMLDSVAVKSVPPRRRTKGGARNLSDSKVLRSSEQTCSDNGFLIDKIKSDKINSEGPAHLEDESISDVEKNITVLSGLQDSLPIHSSVGYLAKSLNCSSLERGQEVVGTNPLQTDLLIANLDPLCSVEKPDPESKELEGCSDDQLPFQKRPRCHDTDCKSEEMGLEQLAKAHKPGVLEMPPEDEVEGGLIYHQHRLQNNITARKHYTDVLICNVAKSLPKEIDEARNLKWDAVLVNQYLCELREAKKQGRKERRHKEAQAVLAAATAAAAASSRISSFRKDVLDEPSNQENVGKLSSFSGRSSFSSQMIPRPKETFPRLAVPRVSVEKHSGAANSSSDISKEHPRSCDICRRFETMFNPILVCSSCKVSVHLDCYRGTRESTGPWYCELCESKSNENVREKEHITAECGLCGGKTGAFRKSSNGQWVHAFCAEWVFESTFKRGQVSSIEGMDTAKKGLDFCYICRRKFGICIKCSYGHCQSTFHPSCGRSSDFYMNVKTLGGKQQHKAYCERHSLEQRAKADTQKHGMDELKSLYTIRAELERLRLICERIIKREKVKRELLICSHDLLAVERDHVSRSVLANSPCLLADGSSESATTSLKANTEDNRSCSDTFQRSDDATVDSTISVNNRTRVPITIDNDQRTDDDSSTSQNQFTQNLSARIQFSEKQIPFTQSVATSNLLEDGGYRSKSKKHTEMVSKGLVMTSDQASLRNMQLPKGYAYVPADQIPNEKQVNQTCSREKPEGDG